MREGERDRERERERQRQREGRDLDLGSGFRHKDLRAQTTTEFQNGKRNVHVFWCGFGGLHGAWEIWGILM